MSSFISSHNTMSTENNNNDFKITFFPRQPLPPRRRSKFPVYKGDALYKWTFKKQLPALAEERKHRDRNAAMYALMELHSSEVTWDMLAEEDQQTEKEDEEEETDPFRYDTDIIHQFPLPPIVTDNLFRMDEDDNDDVPPIDEDDDFSDLFTLPEQGWTPTSTSSSPIPIRPPNGSWKEFQDAYEDDPICDFANTIPLRPIRRRDVEDDEDEGDDNDVGHDDFCLGYFSGCMCRSWGPTSSN
jgi:hypothetical protein